jgi:hypothetical protein
MGITTVEITKHLCKSHIEPHEFAILTEGIMPEEELNFWREHNKGSVQYSVNSD